MQFEYDYNKSKANLAKHGIRYSDAKKLWEDPQRIELVADSGSDEIDQYLDWSKSRRGGAREGAGRKPKNSVRLEVMIRPELREKIRRQAKQKGITQVELVEFAIERL